MFFIDKQKLKHILLAIIPGILASIYLNNDLGLLASFYAVCVIIPLGKSHSSHYLSLFNFVFIFIESIIISYLINYAWLLASWLILHSIIFAMIEHSDSKLKSMLSWTFIGMIYGGVKINHYEIIWHQLFWPLLFLVIIIALFGCLLTLLFEPHRNQLFNFVRPQWKHVFLYSKYILPIAITILLWKSYHLVHFEWLIWSSFSVINVQADKSWQKFNCRLSAAILGICFALFVNNFIDNNILIYYLSFIGIMLSFCVTENYLVSFAMRCFCIVIFASHAAEVTALSRCINIGIGGFIGVTMSFILSALQKTSTA